jgi:hypothetical protein
VATKTNAAEADVDSFIMARTGLQGGGSDANATRRLVDVFWISGGLVSGDERGAVPKEGATMRGFATIETLSAMIIMRRNLGSRDVPFLYKKYVPRCALDHTLHDLSRP